MHFVVQSRSKRARAFVEHIMPSMIKQLGLTRSRKVLVVRIANELDEGIDGLTMPFSVVDSFIVVIKPGKLEAMGLTLAHEMVHVRQMALGMLKTENGVNVWRGKRYTKRTKYLNMPWEVDAFSKQELIFRRAIE
jgi:hypothetical protein